MGYLKESIGYYFYHPTQQKVFVGRHVIFLEKEFIQEESSGRSVELEKVQNLQPIQNSEADSQPDGPLLRYKHCTHLLFEVQVECVMYLSGMGLSLRMTTHLTSLRMMIP